MDDMSLGSRIAFARKIRGKTLDEVARSVGVHKSTIQRYEKSEYANPKLPVIESIARALSVNPAWLIGKSEDMEPLVKTKASSVPPLPASLSFKLSRLDEVDQAKVEAYTDGLLDQDKYKAVSSAG